MNLTVRSLIHTFQGKPPRPALQNINFEVPSGQFVAIVGPSGCGKSTLLRIIADLIRPTGGEIVLDGRTPAQAIADRRIAWMSQAPALMPWLNAQSNIAMAAHFLAEGQARLSPAEALSRVGLVDSAKAYPFMLSGGMQQRLALARTLVLPADLWLMDEPFASLDELTRERLTGELLELWRAFQPTVLWVTHHLAEALRLADRVLVFSPHPARITADLPVRLPRPRNELSVDFVQALSALRKALADE